MVPDKYDKFLVVIGGPTAVGKTAMAIRIAQEWNTEIISADSRQVFKELNIGTAKPDPEELATIKHHFISSHSIQDTFSAGIYAASARKVLRECFSRNDLVVATGGSGLYISALCHGLDEMPETDPLIRSQLNSDLETKGLGALLQELRLADPEHYEWVDRENPRRIVRALEVIRQSGKPYSQWREGNRKESQDFGIIMTALEMEREPLYRRIDQRMDRMIQEGLFEEARGLIAHRDHPALQTVGYREIFSYLDGLYDKAECIRLLKRNSRRYAKRQLTWFRNQEEMKWFAAGDQSGLSRYIRSVSRK